MNTCDLFSLILSSVQDRKAYIQNSENGLFVISHLIDKLPGRIDVKQINRGKYKSWDDYPHLHF